MSELRRTITRADLNDAFKGGAPGLYCAAIFDNPKLSVDDYGADSGRLSPELHALVCAMRLMTDAAQGGAEAIIERHEPAAAFTDGIRLLGWPELDQRLGRFLKLMEPYTKDEKWWARLRWLSDAGAFNEFKGWFWEQEAELDHRVQEFVRKNEQALFIVVD